jgi:hypothetical protein
MKKIKLVFLSLTLLVSWNAFAGSYRKTTACDDFFKAYLKANKINTPKVETREKPKKSPDSLEEILREARKSVKKGRNYI